MEDLEISCEALKARLDAGESICLVDCREQWEFERVKLSEAALIPMHETPARIEEYREKTGPVIVYCHHGMRSLNVVTWLRQNGVENVQSLAGGIDSWSLLVDRSLPRY